MEYSNIQKSKSNHKEVYFMVAFEFILAVFGFILAVLGQKVVSMFK